MKIITLIILTALLLSGCSKKTVDEKKGNIFTSIEDAISKQMVLKCDYSDEDGQVVTTYIKGREVRLKGSGEQANVEGLMKDNSFYLWDGIKKEGMEIDMTKMSADGSVKMGEKPIKSIDDVIEVLKEKENSCKLSPESAGLLELPTDVKFTKSEDIF